MHKADKSSGEQFWGVVVCKLAPASATMAAVLGTDLLEEERDERLDEEDEKENIF